MAESRLEKIFEDINKATKKLKDNDQIKEARSLVKKALDSYTLTDDDRAARLIDFELQLALGVFDRMGAIASESDVIEEKLKAAKLETFKATAELQKQYGLKVDDEGKLVEGKEGLIDKQMELTQKQIDGFDKDQIHKANKTNSEVMFGLAMNGTAIPKWMSDSFKLLTEIQVHGVVDIENIPNPAYDANNPESPEYLTSVRQRDNATKSDGIYN